jgi:hypothetical protein
MAPKVHPTTEVRNNGGAGWQAMIFKGISSAKERPDEGRSAAALTLLPSPFA